jgi:hypothetical protein
MIVLIILGVLLLGGSIFADYKWRRWMAARREERNHNPDLRA